jgi:hypothetical protein
MAGLDLDRTLTKGRARAFLDDLEGRPLVEVQRKGARDRTIEWLRNIASETDPRGSDGLPPHCAAALLDHYYGRVPLDEYAADAEFAREWIEAIAAERPKPVGECCLYVMAAPSAVKIGISNHPASRLASIQTSNPEPVSIFSTWLFPSREIARGFEVKLHTLFAEKRTIGEWFAVSADEVAQIVNEWLGRALD